MTTLGQEVPRLSRMFDLQICLSDNKLTQAKLAALTRQYIELKNRSVRSDLIVKVEEQGREPARGLLKEAAHIGFEDQTDSLTEIRFDMSACSRSVLSETEQPVALVMISYFATKSHYSNKSR